MKDLEVGKLKPIKLFAEFNIVLSVLVFISIFLLVQVMRGPFLIGDESYFNLRTAENILEENKIPDYDELSYGGREISYPIGYPFLLFLFSFLTGSEIVFASKAVPFILSIFNLILFYLILKNLNIDSRIRTLSSLVLIISPPFLYLNNVSTNISMILFLGLLGFLFLIKNKKIFSAIPFLLMIFFNIILTYISLLVLFFYISKRKKDIIWFFLILLLIVAGTFFLYGFNFGYREDVGVSSFISDLGGEFGIGVFSIIPMIFGLKAMWKEKYKHSLTYFLLILLILLSSYYIETLFYLNLFVTVIAAFGINEILNIKWESSLIKRFALLIISLGMIFSGLSFINVLSDMNPNDEVFALNYLREDSEPDDTVFSHYSRGNWISGIAERRNVMDSNFINAPSLEERINNSYEIFYSRESDRISELLSKYSVDYVFIDSDLKRRLWKSEEEGLLLSFKYDKRFKIVYKTNSVEIWKFEA